MINFEIANSTFFEENKNYINDLLEKWDKYNPKATGYCNSYGYDITVQLNKFTYPTIIKLQKQQNTQSGSLKPIDAIDCYKTELNFNNVFIKNNVEIGRSKISRLFTKNKFKKILGPPYYLKSTNDNISEIITDFIALHNIEFFKLHNNELTVKTHNKITCSEILLNLEKLIKNSA